MSTAAHMRGAVGCVCDTQIRDCEKIRDLGFPVFLQGIRPLDSLGRARVMDYDVPVRCGDVLVKPGMMVYADFDGVVCIPQQVEEQTLNKAVEKIKKENVTRKELMEGESLRKVYQRYGVL